jgi:hypothetical protein
MVEEVTISHAGWFNERIVPVCAAGLIAGPRVGLAVSLFVSGDRDVGARIALLATARAIGFGFPPGRAVARDER